MYDELFDRVMKEKDPKQALIQAVMHDRKSFDTYKDGMNELQQRIDKAL